MVILTTKHIQAIVIASTRHVDRFITAAEYSHPHTLVYLAMLTRNAKYVAKSLLNNKKASVQFYKVYIQLIVSR